MLTAWTAIIVLAGLLFLSLLLFVAFIVYSRRTPRSRVLLFFAARMR